MNVKLIKAYSKVGKVGCYIDMPCKFKETDYCKNASYVIGEELKQAGLYLLSCLHCKRQWEWEFDIRDDSISSKGLSRDVCKQCNEQAGYFWVEKDNLDFFDKKRGRTKCPRQVEKGAQFIRQHKAWRLSCAKPHKTCSFKLEHILDR